MRFNISTLLRTGMSALGAATQLHGSSVCQLASDRQQVKREGTTPLRNGFDEQN